MVGGWTKTKLTINSTQVEVEVGVELGNVNLFTQLGELMGSHDNSGLVSRLCSLLLTDYWHY